LLDFAQVGPISVGEVRAAVLVGAFIDGGLFSLAGEFVGGSALLAHGLGPNFLVFVVAG